jgi:hypothetical protein
MYGIYRNDWMDRIRIRADTWDARIHNSKTGQKNVSKTIRRKIVLSFFRNQSKSVCPARTKYSTSRQRSNLIFFQTFIPICTDRVP